MRGDQKDGTIDEISIQALYDYKKVAEASRMEGYIISIQALYDYKSPGESCRAEKCQFQFKHCTIISVTKLE